MEIRIPEVGESVSEALIAKWHVKNGERVHREQPVCELETDKVTLEINAEAEGILSILMPEGKTVKTGTVIGIVQETVISEPVASADAATRAAAPPLSPAARKLAREKGIRPETISGSGRKGRVLAEDLSRQGAAERPREDHAGETASAAALRDRNHQGEESAPSRVAAVAQPVSDRERPVTRRPLTPIRKKIAEQLARARQQTAMATTFSEADMGRIIALRRKYKDHFLQKHNVSLGFMSFFVKASVEALKEFPDLNARIDQDDIVYHHYYDIGIAVSGEKGLVVPVLRNADGLHFAGIEQSIDRFVEKIRDNTLAMAEIEGGTFTISNGGIFGSLLGTPLLNPPQSAILGMHAIQDRPVALLGKVVIRPMMYLALTYDHRIVDGRDAVLFLKKVKEYVEEPEEILLEG